MDEFQSEISIISSVFVLTGLLGGFRAVGGLDATTVACVSMASSSDESISMIVPRELAPGLLAGMAFDPPSPPAAVAVVGFLALEEDSGFSGDSGFTTTYLASTSSRCRK